MQLTSSPLGQSCCFLITTLLIALTIVQPSLQLSNSEEDLKRASHNIMRFGRTAGHNIMRFGRAGHNIMHFGKRDPTLAALQAPEVADSPPSSGFASASGDPAAEVPNLELEALPADYQALLYTPYRRFNYNKKADNRDNVFMHFG